MQHFLPGWYAAHCVTARAVCAGPEGCVKCFYCGQRFGIWLPKENVSSRRLLAEALNEAYAGSIVSCGRGDRLSVVFIDGNGRVQSFPAIKSRISQSEKDAQGSKSQQWGPACSDAVRVVVSLPGKVATPIT